jgi:hypothetical protein
MCSEIGIGNAPVDQRKYLAQIVRMTLAARRKPRR